MDKLEEFYEQINKEMAMVLATSFKNKVSMRLVSPVLFNKDVLIFTHSQSNKYQQLKNNPNCCLSINNMFIESIAEFYGNTMLPQNKEMREVYNKKFPGAFDDNVEFGGIDAEFILIHPVKLTGWRFENDIPTADGIPTIPFEILID